jgi:TPR repeat protein
MCLLNGDGVDEDAEKASEFFQMAAEQDMAQAQVSEENFSLSNFQYMLGFCHEMGQGVPKDFKKAYFLYTKAAEQGVRIAGEGAKRIKKIIGVIGTKKLNFI